MSLNLFIKRYKKLFNENLNPFEWSEEYSKVILNVCQKVKNNILETEDFNSYFQNPQYVKAVLLESIAKQILIEIAPKRIKRRGMKNVK